MASPMCHCVDWSRDVSKSAWWHARSVTMDALDDKKNTESHKRFLHTHIHNYRLLGSCLVRSIDNANCHWLLVCTLNSARITSVIKKLVSFSTVIPEFCRRVCAGRATRWTLPRIPPKCTKCNQLLSVKHILTECTLYDQTRHEYCSFTDIRNVFNHTPRKIY